MEERAERRQTGVQRRERRQRWETSEMQLLYKWREAKMAHDRGWEGRQERGNGERMFNIFKMKGKEERAD